MEDKGNSVSQQKFFAMVTKFWRMENMKRINQESDIVQ